jgi:hypothetical protein
MRLRAVNREWRAKANKFLSQLEDLKDSKYPIYTREEFFEKLRTVTARVQLDQHFFLHVRQFGLKSNPLSPIIACNFFSTVHPNSPSSERAICFKALIDEENRMAGTPLPPKISRLETILPNNRRFIRQFNIFYPSSSPRDLVAKIQEIIKERVDAERLNQCMIAYRQVGLRHFNITKMAIIILISLIALHIFKNAIGQSGDVL